MASQVAMFTGLSGLNANARSLDVIGNNIANVNTTAFKSSRLMFQNVFSKTVGIGAPPSSELGGSNPFQIGLGVTIAGTQRDTSGGTVTTTGNATDLAIEGQGYFVVQRGTSQMYTRAGAFQRDASNALTTIAGDRLQGFGVDDEFNIVPGTVGDIVVPVGGLTLTQQTRNVAFSGNLNAAGDAATAGASIDLLADADTGFSLITGATITPTPPNVLEGTSLLTEIADPDSAATPLFAAGQSLLLTGARKGSTTLRDATLGITAATTVADLLAFLTSALGIDTSLTNPTGPTPGVALDPATGRLTVTGNTGVENDLEIDAADLRLLDSTGAIVVQPFVADKSADATGESARTTFVVYDSLGQEVGVDLTMVLESKADTGTVWRAYVESSGQSGDTPLVGSSLVSFDTFGRLISGGSLPVTVDRSGTGAATPLAFSINLSDGSNGVSALADVRSVLAATGKDGAPIGTLEAFGVGADGTISGTFSNGLVRTLGQVALATFSNPGGLVDDGSNLYTTGANSGEPVITPPASGQAGRILGGTLELSNVDLGQEFTSLILATTGYSASSRVIRTADELMQQLLILGQ
ncbi:MAG: flagellar hook-basal body complex protein [Phycisphaeraceae bacterium]|nr:flagellar hook-basal body complex protein [Phycisphaeraceae bacterium]